VKKLKKITGPISKLNLEEVPLNPWTEYVGKVVDVTDTSITLEATIRVLIPISTDALNKWNDTIRKDNHVAVLALDDGSIRVRKVQTC
jgi:hypothetical protein